MQQPTTPQELVSNDSSDEKIPGGVRTLVPPCCTFMCSCFGGPQV